MIYINCFIDSIKELNDDYSSEICTSADRMHREYGLIREQNNDLKICLSKSMVSWRNGKNVTIKIFDFLTFFHVAQMV